MPIDCDLQSLKSYVDDPEAGIAQYRLGRNYPRLRLSNTVRVLRRHVVVYPRLLYIEYTQIHAQIDRLCLKPSASRRTFYISYPKIVISRENVSILRSYGL